MQVILDRIKRVVAKAALIIFTTFPSTRKLFTFYINMVQYDDQLRFQRTGKDSKQSLLLINFRIYFTRYHQNLVSLLVSYIVSDVLKVFFQYVDIHSFISHEFCFTFCFVFCFAYNLEVCKKIWHKSFNNRVNLIQKPIYFLLKIVISCI